MTTVTIGGEDRVIAPFSAYKAIYAMSIVSSVQAEFRAVLAEGATFKREYEAENVVTMTRSTARQHFRPRTLSVERPDGTIGPALDSNENPILGPDPLGHLTEHDWEASGHRLELPESPDQRLVWAAMVEAGFRLARVHVLRIIALSLATNADLEKWDEDGDGESIDAELDREAQRLVHRCSADELVRVAIVSATMVKEQLAGPLGDARAALKTIGKDTENPAESPEPMRVETPEDGDSTRPPTSSTSSPEGTDGDPVPPGSSTEPDGSSSFASSTA